MRSISDCDFMVMSSRVYRRTSLLSMSPLTQITHTIPGFLTYASVTASLSMPQVSKPKAYHLFPTHRKHALGMMQLQSLSSSFCTA